MNQNNSLTAHTKTTYCLALLASLALNIVFVFESTFFMMDDATHA